MLRAYVGQAALPPGWLRVLTDERLRPALSLVHADPRVSLLDLLRGRMRDRQVGLPAEGIGPLPQDLVLVRGDRRGPCRASHEQDG
ncbi:hypothetical protein [Nonomuraea turkmeniaca]|uniref:hypothetical protein n=1 Tax=Nonomuraea turkmeniaca TaxID=103838 RepID=UPI001B86FC05|nr:hypothetical protein [Nonomuraea turkmeniaca]